MKEGRNGGIEEGWKSGGIGVEEGWSRGGRGVKEGRKRKQLVRSCSGKCARVSNSHYRVPAVCYWPAVVLARFLLREVWLEEIDVPISTILYVNWTDNGYLTEACLPERTGSLPISYPWQVQKRLSTAELYIPTCSKDSCENRALTSKLVHVGVKKLFGKVTSSFLTFTIIEMGNNFAVRAEQIFDICSCTHEIKNWCKCVWNFNEKNQRKLRKVHNIHRSVKSSSFFRVTPLQRGSIGFL